MSNVVVGPVTSGILLVLLFVALFYFSLCAALTMPLIVDRRLGVFDAFATSRRFMQGNKLTLLLIWVVVSLGRMALVIPTCGPGFLAFIPFGCIMWIVIYLKATGQPVME